MRIKYILIAVATAIFSSCSDNYINELFVEPEAAFEIKQGNHPDHYEVFESVVFQNTGAGQKYAIYTGDKGHIYGEDGSTGFATASGGSFTYSYQEPGEYPVVWVATSIKNDGTIVEKRATRNVTVISTDGGLETFSVSNFYTMPEYGSLQYTAYGEFVFNNTIVCPIMYASWKKFSLISKTRKLTTNFRLSSSLAKMYWINPDDNSENEIVSGSTATRVVGFTDNDGRLQVQKFKVKTASGIYTQYDIAVLMIPCFTGFSVTVNGTVYKADITRDLANYDKYFVKLALPHGTNLNGLKPEFTVLNNDGTLTDGANYTVKVNGTVQKSGETVVDLSSGQVSYEVEMKLLGSVNEKLSVKAEMIVTVNK